MRISLSSRNGTRKQVLYYPHGSMVELKVGMDAYFFYTKQVRNSFIYIYLDKTNTSASSEVSSHSLSLGELFTMVTEL